MAFKKFFATYAACIACGFLFSGLPGLFVGNILRHIIDIPYADSILSGFSVDTAEAASKTKTIVYFVGSIASSTSIVSGATTTFAFTITIPDMVPTSTPIRSAYILYNTHMGAANITASSFTLNTQTGSAQTLTGISALNNSGESNQLDMRLNATTAMQNLIGNASGTYPMTFTAKITGPTRDNEGAELYLTYDYDPWASTQINTAYLSVYSSSTQVGTSTKTSPIFNFNLPEASVTSTFVSGASSTNHFWIEYRGYVTSTVTLTTGWDSETLNTSSFSNTINSHDFLMLVPPKTASSSPSVAHTFKMTSSGGSSTLSAANAVAIATYTYNFDTTAKFRKTLQVLLTSTSSSVPAATTTINTQTVINVPEANPSSTDAFIFGHTIFVSSSNPGINATSSAVACVFPATTPILIAPTDGLIGEVTGYPAISWQTPGVQVNASGNKNVCSAFSTTANSAHSDLILFLSYDYARQTTSGARFNMNGSFFGIGNYVASTTFPTSSINATISDSSSSKQLTWLRASFDNHGTGNAVPQQNFTLGAGSSTVTRNTTSTGENTYAELFSTSTPAALSASVGINATCSASCTNSGSYEAWWQTDLGAASTTQIHYHWRNDDGSQTGATNAAAEDNSTNTFKGVNYRLRIEVNNAGDATSSLALRIEYQQNATSGAWTQVATGTVGSTHWQMQSSTFLNSGTSTTNISTASGGTTDTNIFFDTGGTVVATTTTNQAATTTLTGLKFTEVEYDMAPTINAVNNATYYFRLTNASTVLNTYSIYPSSTVTSSVPAVSSVLLNHGNALTLTPNATTSFDINYSISDPVGCSSIVGALTTSTAFRFAASSTCAVPNPIPNTLSCYQSISHATSSCSNGIINTTDTVALYYFADATDSSSSYPTQHWEAYAAAQNIWGSTSSATSSAVELNTLVAINVTTSTLNYGTLAPSSTTTSTNQIATVQNAGNSSTTLTISGTVLSSGANSLATSSQHYATTTFTFGGNEQVLSSTAQSVSGSLMKPLPFLSNSVTTTPRLSPTYSHSAVVNNGYIYVTGGSDSGANATSTVSFAQINADGSVGRWATTTPLPAVDTAVPVVVNNGYIYAMGGIDPASSATATVLFAQISATSSVGGWATTTPLPAARYFGPAVVNNGYIYIMGGSVTGGALTSTVLFAQISATSSVGRWATTTPLPAVRSQSVAVVNNGYIYVTGGIDVSNFSTATVLFAQISATSSVGRWATTTPLPASVYEHSAVVNNGYIYVTGGAYTSSENNTSSIFFAQISATSSVGRWINTAPLPLEIINHSSVINNGNIYSIAGKDISGNVVSTVAISGPFQNTYWGIQVPFGSAAGSYTGTNTFTSVFAP